MTIEHDYVVPTLGRGPDHGHHDYLPLNATRPRLTWPGAAPVALCVLVTLEHVEWRDPEDGYVSPSLAGGYGKRPHPDITRWSHREYGHRVGIFRILDVLHRRGVTPTVAMDATTARHYPFLVEHCLGLGAEFVGHGISVSRMITSRMSEAGERSYIAESLDALQAAAGQAVRGWLGPEYSESTHTPALLAEAGLRYVCDWANDEQPYRMTVPNGELFSLPITYPLDDVDALWDRRIEGGRWATTVTEAFDRLRQDGAGNGRILVLNLHPWLTGQAFRIHHVDDMLTHILASGEVWAGTGSQIVEWYAAQTSTPPITERSP
jgi:peptidoglycan/xylan/chitin deacetylase (PgdA/CDA1 family)